MVEYSYYYNKGLNMGGKRVCISGRRRFRPFWSGFAAACFCVALLLSVLCGAEAGDTACVHNYQTWYVRTAPSCQQEGLMVSACTVCGHEGYEVIPKVPHTMGTQQAVQMATCTQAGYSETECLVCHKTVREEIPILPHSYAFSHYTVPSGCDAGGFKVYQCSVCGHAYQESFSGHLMGNWVVIKEAACEQDGSMQSVCQACGMVSTKPIMAQGHRLGPERIVMAGNCSTAGIAARDCQICRKTFETELPLVPHDFLPPVVQLPGCTRNGAKVFSCKVCGFERTETILATGHDPKVERIAAGCLKPGQQVTSCTRCSWVEVLPLPALGHDLNDWQIVVHAACDKEGLEKQECSRCGFTQERKLPALHHLYTSWTRIAASTCTQTGSQSAVCSLCGQEQVKEIPLAGHQFGYWRKARCADCAVSTTYARQCLFCPFTEQQDRAASNHVYGVWEIFRPATCTASGVRQRACKYCGAIQQESIPQRAHQPGRWVVAKAAQLYQNGIQQKSCKLCGTVLQERSFYPGDLYFASTFCALGPSWQDATEGLIPSRNRFAVVDITKRGALRLPLVGDGTHAIGEVMIEVDDNTIQVSYTLFSKDTKVLKERLQLFSSAHGLTLKKVEANRKGYSVGKPVILSKKLRTTGYLLVSLRLEGICFPDSQENWLIDWDLGENARLTEEMLLLAQEAGLFKDAE